MDFGHARFIFNGNAICPAAPLEALGFQKYRENRVFVVHYLGCGIRPPTSTLVHVGYSNGNSKKTVKVEFLGNLCPSNQHSTRTEDTCRFCGRHRYDKAFIKSEHLPQSNLFAVNLGFARIAYENQPDIFTIKLDEINDSMFKVTHQETNQPIPGSFVHPVKSWNNLEVPTILWKSSAPLRPGNYNVDFHEDLLPFTGNPSPLLGLTQFSFVIQ
jgi:hypothetical protein